MEVLDDVTVDQNNLLAPRRGFDQLPGQLPATNQRMNRFGYYQGTTDSVAYLIGHWDTDQFGYYSSSTWNNYTGSFPPPSATLARTRFLQQNNNFYFTTNKGIYKLDSVENDTPKAAGEPPGLDIQLALTGSSGFFSAQSQGSFVGTLTSGSPTITGLTSTPGNIAVGQYLACSPDTTFIPSGTTVSSINASTLAGTPTTSATDAAGQTTLHVSSVVGLAAGQLVSDFSGTLIQTGTTVSSVGVGLVVLSLALKRATAVGTPEAIQFLSAPTITMSANAAGGAPTSETISYLAGSQVAYRMVWGKKDLNNNIILGAPSNWVAISNTTGHSSNVTINFSIPSGITTADFYQIYRTFQTPSIAITPNDEMQLCYEGNPIAGDIAIGTLVTPITDSLIDALLGVSLYTSPSQQGIGQAYYPPPMAKDFCSFQNYVFYANTTLQQTINLTILGTDAPNGIQINDVLTIGGIAFTAKGAQNIAANEFKVTYSTASITPAQAIIATTNSLIQVINQSSTSTVYAYGQSGPTSLPGQILLTSRTFGQTAFVLTASAHGAAYNPILPTSGTTVTSTNITYLNGVYASVQGLPEAVPRANLLPLIGSSAEPILRIIALRDYIVVLKTDGVFRIVGNNLANFQVLAFDYTTKIVAPDSAVSLNNQVWCVANQGIVSISDSGVQQQSWTNINTIIQELLGTASTQVAQYASAVAYETEHKYILGIPSSSGDTANTQTYTYNIFTSAWTRWTRQFSCGFIQPVQNSLYLGNAQNNKIAIERKNLSYTDYIDEAVATPNILSYSGYVVTVDTVTNITVGDLLFQDANDASVITAIDTVALALTVQDPVAWAIATSTVYAAINSIAQWKPVVAGNPGFLRQYSEGDLIFNVTRFNQATVSFFTDIVPSSHSVPLIGNSTGSWGLFTWGLTVPWGGASAAAPIRFYIPMETQLGSQLNVTFNIRQAWSNWSLNGANIVYQDVSGELDG